MSREQRRMKSAEYSEQQTGECYQLGHVWWILREMGLSGQQPPWRAIKRSEVAIPKWTKQGWLKPKKRRPKSSRSFSAKKVD